MQRWPRELFWRHAPALRLESRAAAEIDRLPNASEDEALLAHHCPAVSEDSSQRLAISGQFKLLGHRSLNWWEVSTRRTIRSGDDLPHKLVAAPTCHRFRVVPGA